LFCHADPPTPIRSSTMNRLGRLGWPCQSLGRGNPI